MNEEGRCTGNSELNDGLQDTTVILITFPWLQRSRQPGRLFFSTGAPWSDRRQTDTLCTASATCVRFNGACGVSLGVNGEERQPRPGP